jgi:hypothetical protein
MPDRLTARTDPTIARTIKHLHTEDTVLISSAVHVGDALRTLSILIQLDTNGRFSTKVAVRLKNTPESIDYRCEIIECPKQRILVFRSH